MLRIGLTGGIGSGKSLAAGIWQKLGRQPSKQRWLIEVDEIARQVVKPGSVVLQKITDFLGTSILLASGELNRALLRRRIFEDDQLRQQLEAIMHPVIRQHILMCFARFDSSEEPASALNQSTSSSALSPASYNASMVILSSPLLFEKQQNALVDKTVVVDVEERVQIQRVMARDHIHSNLVRKIMRTQLTREERLQRADFVIDNNKSPLHLGRQIRLLDKKLVSEI